jgi:hypothetical protein
LRACQAFEIINKKVLYPTIKGRELSLNVELLEAQSEEIKHELPMETHRGGKVAVA